MVEELGYRRGRAIGLGDLRPRPPGKALRVLHRHLVASALRGRGISRPRGTRAPGGGGPPHGGGTPVGSEPDPPELLRPGALPILPLRPQPRPFPRCIFRLRCGDGVRVGEAAPGTGNGHHRGKGGEERWRTRSGIPCVVWRWIPTRPRRQWSTRGKPTTSAGRAVKKLLRRTPNATFPRKATAAAAEVGPELRAKPAWPKGHAGFFGSHWPLKRNRAGGPRSFQFPGEPSPLPKRDVASAPVGHATAPPGRWW